MAEACIEAHRNRPHRATLSGKHCVSQQPARSLSRNLIQGENRAMSRFFPTARPSGEAPRSLTCQPFVLAACAESHRSRHHRATVAGKHCVSQQPPSGALCTRRRPRRQAAISLYHMIRTGNTVCWSKGEARMAGRIDRLPPIRRRPI
jgi:hypothetical protein